MNLLMLGHLVFLFSVNMILINWLTIKFLQNSLVKHAWWIICCHPEGKTFCNMSFSWKSFVNIKKFICLSWLCNYWFKIYPSHWWIEYFIFIILLWCKNWFLHIRLIKNGFTFISRISPNRSGNLLILSIESDASAFEIFLAWSSQVDFWVLKEFRCNRFYCLHRFIFLYVLACNALISRCFNIAFTSHTYFFKIGH